jgi:hypothetical protein
VALIEPQEPLTQPIPPTFHVTDLFVVPATAAENCCCPLVARTTSLGDTTTEMVVDDTIVTVEVAVAVTSAREVTVTVTVEGEGAFAGAM